MKHIILLFTVLFSTVGCNHYNILPSIDDDKILTDKNGGIVRNCNGRMLTKDWPGTQAFWEKNNLPQGTTEFVCVDGKAYLPGKEPK